MAAASKRKHFFILGFFLTLAIVIAVLVLREIPAPVTEHVTELDSSNLIRK